MRRGNVDGGEIVTTKVEYLCLLQTCSTDLNGLGFSQAFMVGDTKGGAGRKKSASHSSVEDPITSLVHLLHSPRNA